MPSRANVSVAIPPAKGAFRPSAIEPGLDPHRLPRLERRVQRPGGLRLDGQDAHVASGSRRRDPCDEPPAAARHDDRVDPLDVLEDLEADGALPCDDERVVERMDEDAPGLLLELGEALEDVPRSRRLLVDRRPVGLRCGTLDLARALEHDDERVDPLLAGAERERSGVVSGRRRDHAARPLLG